MASGGEHASSSGTYPDNREDAVRAPWALHPKH